MYTFLSIYSDAVYAKVPKLLHCLGRNFLVSRRSPIQRLAPLCILIRHFSRFLFPFLRSPTFGSFAITGLFRMQTPGHDTVIVSKRILGHPDAYYRDFLILRRRKFFNASSDETKMMNDDFFFQIILLK